MPSFYSRSVMHDRAEKAKAALRMASSPDSAPGWRVAGRPFWTCVDLPDHPRDPAIVRAIRDFEPQAIPMVRKMVYIPPGSKERVVVAHHAIGRFVPQFLNSHVAFYVEMPLEATHPVPNLIEFVNEDLQHPIVRHFGGPPPYRPFDEEFYMVLRTRYEHGVDISAWEQLVEREASRIKDEMARWADEMCWRQKHLEKKLRPILDQLTDDDFKQYAAQQLAKRRLRARMQGASA